MGELRIVYTDCETEDVTGVYSFDIYGSTLVLRDVAGAIIGQRVHVARAAMIVRE